METTFDFGDLLFTEDACLVCDNNLLLEWTDYHGEGVCIRCGTPYQVYFYGEEESDGRIQDTLPMFTLRADLYDAMRDYWQTKERNMGLGMYLGRHPYDDYYGDFIKWLKQSEWSALLEKEAG